MSTKVLIVCISVSNTHSCMSTFAEFLPSFSLLHAFASTALYKINKNRPLLSCKILLFDSGVIRCGEVFQRSISCYVSGADKRHRFPFIDSERRSISISLGRCKRSNDLFIVQGFRGSEGFLILTQHVNFCAYFTQERVNDLIEILSRLVLRL